MPAGQLEGKTVLVTGAAAGIGLAISHAVISAGARAVLVDRDPIDCRDFEVDGDRVTSIVADLRDLDSMRKLGAEVQTKFGPLDGLVNAAGVITRRASIEEVTAEDFDIQYEVNLRGAFFAVTLLRPAMARGSSIVLFSSQGWWTGGLGGSLPYSATKAGVVALTRGFSRELAPDIRVNAIAPGFVDTAMMANGVSEDQLESLLKQVPLGRMASPSEIADVAMFLVGEASRYMTGATLNVSGGQLVY